MFTKMHVKIRCLFLILLVSPLVYAITTSAPKRIETTITARNSPLGELFGPVVNSFAGPTNNEDSIMKMFIPEGLSNNLASVTRRPTTTTTTTTTISTPIDMIAKSISVPAKAIDKALGIEKKGPLESTAERLAEATKFSGKLIGTLAGVPTRLRQEDESNYYEFSPEPDPIGSNQRKYFSRECHFKVACEVGKAMRVFSPPIVRKMVETSKVIQDLQSRYTRAMTYGMLYNDCERYYCLFVRFFGGPKEFAGAVAELVNRMANPDLYE